MTGTCTLYIAEHDRTLKLARDYMYIAKTGIIGLASSGLLDVSMFSIALGFISHVFHALFDINYHVLNDVYGIYTCTYMYILHRLIYSRGGISGGRIGLNIEHNFFTFTITRCVFICMSNHSAYPLWRSL